MTATVQEDVRWFAKQSQEAQAVFWALRELTSPEMFISFAFLERHTDLSRSKVRRLCRYLSRRGFAGYGSGLWSEDGYPMGAGYGLSARGWALARVLENDDSID